MEKENLILNKMKEGAVYRRADLAPYSAAIDRHLNNLVEKKELVKVSGGLYLKPKESAFGLVPADDRALVKSFLKDNQFLVNSFNNYNQLGLGLTQLYAMNIVYNHKRFGEFDLGGKKFFFKRVPKFPRKLSKEYLLVDMLNNFKNLAEDEKNVLVNLKNKKENFDAKKVLYMAREYGRPRTKKLLNEVF